MAITKNTSQIKDSEQIVLNKSKDDKFDVLAVEVLEYDPVSDSLKRKTTASGGAFGTNNIDEASSTLTYVGKEDADGAWVIQKIDTENGVSITYATQKNNPTIDNYSDAWTNRSSLTFGTYKEAF